MTDPLAIWILGYREIIIYLLPFMWRVHFLSVETPLGKNLFIVGGGLSLATTVVAVLGICDLAVLTELFFPWYWEWTQG
jgi:hypothetical protein